MSQPMIYCAVLLLFLWSISARDPVSDQLVDYKKQHPDHTDIETSFGSPVSNLVTSLTAGPRGPMLLQDLVFLDEMAHFDRERIPARVVHDRGSGAQGYFEVTKDITRYSKAKVFEHVGKITNITVRLSMATSFKGTPETNRDPRGFAIKFYTDEGIWDLIGFNSPVFFIKDGISLPSLVHAFLTNPVTNVKDPDAQWDYFTQVPETVYHVMKLFSDSGIPDGYRHMNGHPINTFKMVNATGHAVYVKFHYLSDQGVKNLMSEEAFKLTATSPDYFTRDLYNAIARGDYPYWTLYIQVMTFEEAENFRWNPFDDTKIWPEEDYPLIEVGKFVLNKNPTNYFADVEQAAFCPAHLVPGIEPSPDKLLQARFFAYSDTQRYRLGANHLQLPVNCPFGKHGVTNYERDGRDAFHNQRGAPNYYPNSFGGPRRVPSAATSKFSVSGDVARYNDHDDDNFSQPTMYWDSLSSGEQKRMAQNIADDFQLTSPFIRDRAIQMFRNVSDVFADKIEEAMKTVTPGYLPLRRIITMCRLLSDVIVNIFT